MEVNGQLIEGSLVVSATNISHGELLIFETDSVCVLRHFGIA